MSHVIDELELYAVGALPSDQADAIERHLAECESCRAVAVELDEIVSRLPEAVPLREPPPQLKQRILAAASGDLRRERRSIRLRRLVPGMRTLAVAATLVLLLGVDTSQAIRLRDMQAQRDEYGSVLATVSHGGRSWYMAGIDQWTGIGGNLVQPNTGEPAFVLFHDLRALPNGQLYALWLISPDGKWVRGTSFGPEGKEMQRVPVGLELAGFERCAVTVEASASGKREGPIVMQSRIAPPAP